MRTIQSKKEVVAQIINYVGGEKNVNNLYHCATRLRFNLIDQSKFNIPALEKLPEVLGAVNSGNESQVVIGADVGIYYQEIVKNFNLGKERQKALANKKNVSLYKRFLNTIVAIMSPVIVVLTAGGMLQVIITILLLLGMSQKSTNYRTLSFIANSAFYFLPFMLASTSAQKFNTNPYLAMMLAGILLHPSFMNMIAQGHSIKLFNIPVKLVNYSSSVVPIILMVLLMSYIDKIAENIISTSVKAMLKPLLIIAVTAPLSLIVIGPFGKLLDQLLITIVNFLYIHVSWLVPTIIGALSPLLIMVGMHISLTPIAIVYFAKFGYENVLGPGMLASNFSQVGAALAIFLREKNQKLRKNALSASFAALSGVSEPGLYKVTLKYDGVLACVMAAGGLAGFYAGITGVIRYSFGSPSIFTLPIFIGSNPRNFINACITAVLSIFLSFVFTYFFARVQDDSQSQDKEKFKSFVNGKVIPLNQVNDQVFSSGSLGKGVAVYPTSETVVAPVTATVSMIFPTGHAVGLKTNQGNEILIHIGLDTAKLKGRGFKALIKEGQKVHSGDPLIRFNLSFICKEGFDPTIIFILVNSLEDNIAITANQKVTTDDEILTLTK